MRSKLQITKSIFFYIQLFLISLLTGQVHAALSGTYTINPGSSATATNYQSLTSAISDMVSGTRADGGTPNGTGVSGPVILELAIGYTSSGETFPLSLTAVTGASATNTVTIRPAAGVGAAINMTANKVIDLNGGDYFIIDGRPAGTGSNKYLELVSNSTSLPVLDIHSDATNNIIQYCILKGANTNSAAVDIKSPTTTGNDNNTITGCDLTASASSPGSVIYVNGASGKTNDNVTISYCSFYNFFQDNSLTVGIYFEDYNTSWNIIGNSFYQTATINPTGDASTYVIYMNGTNHNNFNIIGNYIGGSTIQCGGSAWTQTGSYDSRFMGMYLQGSGTAHSVHGNTITNFAWTSTNNTSTAPGVWTGIHVASGNAGIGNIAGNRVGAGNGTGAILITNNSSNSSFTSGISNTSTGTINISNNEIGSITTACSTINAAANIYAIWASGNATYTMNGNSIGSTITANSINASAASTYNDGQSVLGIYFNGSGSNSATNNSIANLNTNFAGTGSMFGDQAFAGGIRSTGGSANIFTGNTIRDISSSSQSTEIRENASVIGIATASYNTATHITSGNTIYNLFNTNTNNSNAKIVGIYMGGGNGSSVANANLIHSLSLTNSTQGDITGFHSDATATISNNMIRLGIDAGGTSIGANHTMFGFYDASDANYYHNTIYIGGTVSVSSSQSTYAYYTQVSAAGRSIVNNIFVNNRSNGSGGSATHSAAVYSGIVGYTIDHNLYLATGTGGFLGGVNSGGQTTLVGFQTATGQDANSITGDPLFVNATGNSSLVNLHLRGTTPAEAAGTNITAVTTDFDGDARGTYTPHDIGADADDFGNTWTGAVDNDWNTAGNWADNSVPTTTESLILSDVTNDPIISGASFTVNNVTVYSGASLTISGSGELVVTGDIDNSNGGTINATGGTITLNGTTAQTLAAGTFTTTNLELDNSTGATITSGTVNVLDTYTPTDGVLTTGGNLVLKSSATGTSLVAAGGSGGGYISGSVTTERYQPGKRCFRFYAHPFTGSIALSQLTDDIDITGAGGASNGFTTTGTNAPSAFWFDVTAANTSTAGNNPGWTAFTSANTASWDRYELLRLLVRGDKGQGLAGGSYTPNASTFDAAGSLNQGTQTITLTKGSGTTFVGCGNPFPSGVQMQNVAVGSNVGANYYAWDATSGVAGAYVTNAWTLPYVLPPYTAFFTNISATDNIVIEEADKAAGGAALFKGTANANWVELLIADTSTKWDRLLIHLDDNAMDVQDVMDGEKLYNPGLDFFTLSKDTVRLAVDVRPYADSASIPLGLTAYNRYNKYVIKTGMFDIPAGTKLFLHDKYLNKNEELKAGHEYWFDVTVDSLSQGNNRFEINMVGKPIVGIAEINMTPKIQLIPNPAHNEVKVSFDKLEGKSTVRLMSVTGQVVFSTVIQSASGSIIVPLTNVPAGVYIVELQGNSARFTEKLIKQ